MTGCAVKENESTMRKCDTAQRGAEVHLTTSDLDVNFCVCRLSMAIHLTGSLAFLWSWML